MDVDPALFDGMRHDGLDESTLLGSFCRYSLEAEVFFFFDAVVDVVVDGGIVIPSIKIF